MGKYPKRCVLKKDGEGYWATSKHLRLLAEEAVEMHLNALVALALRREHGGMPTAKMIASRVVRKALRNAIRDSGE